MTEGFEPLTPDEEEAIEAEWAYDPTERPVEREGEPGKWDALDSNGWGHSLGYSSPELVEAWLAGYDTDSEENR